MDANQPRKKRHRSGFNPNCSTTAGSNSISAAPVSTGLPNASVEHLFAQLRMLPSSLLVNHRSDLRACLQRADAFEKLSTWSHLPVFAIQRVATLLSSPQSFVLCASSRDYHAAQPKLQVLAIGCEPGKLAPSWLSHVSLKELLTIYIDRHEPAHMILERVSARHGAELTHVYLVACQDGTPDTTAPLGVKLIPNLRDPSTYGRHLTALRSLHLEHPSRGASPYACDEAYIASGQALNICAARLILRTQGTLRALCIDAKCHMPASTVRSLLPRLSALEYIRLNLVPFVSLPFHGAGDEDETARLLNAARRSLPALAVDPLVLCHAPAWQRDPAARPFGYRPPEVGGRLPKMDDACFLGAMAV